EIVARFLETPYLWGGRSGLGIDCSGLVQLAMLMTVRAAPRDTDMQAAGLGQPIDRPRPRNSSAPPSCYGRWHGGWSPDL
ncbi:NlpC/P60 family protein, partial [Rhizobium leguminosarum]|uniref:NlpC/P60 family protein n=1 Tax=Rhizobium leguminosarum TaxID=384 RepID=UPI003F9E317C